MIKFFRNIDTDFFDPVLVNMFYQKADIVVQGDGLSFLGQIINLFNDVTADGIIIIGIQR